MTNVLCIAPYRFLPAHTGGQKAIFLLYKYLHNHIHLTCVSTQSNEVAHVPFHVEKVFTDNPLRYINLFYCWQLKKIMLEKHIEYIHIEHPYTGILGLVLKKITGKKLIIRSHNIEAERFRTLGKKWWRLMFYLERMVHRHADFSFFITEEDRQYALKNFKLSADKTGVLTYGSEISERLTPEEKNRCVSQLKKTFQLQEDDIVMLFNGSFDYTPNLHALILLLDKIMPTLNKFSRKHKLIVCGKNIPEELQQRQVENVYMAGFVEDIEAFFKGASLFLNPVWEGGGIKTKLVEAICYGASAVSFSSGAIGVSKAMLGDKIYITNDLDVDAFVQGILSVSTTIADSPPESFYHHFAWKNIAASYVAQVENLR